MMYPKKKVKAYEMTVYCAKEEGEIKDSNKIKEYSGYKYGQTLILGEIWRTEDQLQLSSMNTTELHSHGTQRNIMMSQITRIERRFKHTS